MLRIYLLQHWSSFSVPAIEEARIEVPTMRRFAGIELINDRIPDETTILTFRRSRRPNLTSAPRLCILSE
jgi:transposase, IS5 family